MEQEKNTHNKILKKIQEILLGTDEEIKTAKETLKNLPKEFKNPKQAITLIIIAMVCFSITYGGMNLLRNIQNEALYCKMYSLSPSDTFKIVEEKFKFGEDGIIKKYKNVTMKLPEQKVKAMPEGEHTYAWLLDYYKDGRKSPWQGINCTLDFKRWYNERF